MNANDRAAAKLFDPPCDSAESPLAEAIVLSDEGYRVQHQLLEPDLTVLKDALMNLDVCHLPNHSGGYNKLEWWESVGRMMPEGPYEYEEVWDCPLPFINCINPKDGVIIASDNKSAAGCLPLDTPLPQLCHWSDVVFLQWLKVKSGYRAQRGKSGLPLHYIFPKTPWFWKLLR